MGGGRGLGRALGVWAVSTVEHLVLEGWRAVGSSILCGAQGWHPAWLPVGLTSEDGEGGERQRTRTVRIPGDSLDYLFFKKIFYFCLALAALGLHC